MSGGGAAAAGAAWHFGPYPIRQSEIFFESRHSVGLVNLKPVVPGHVLVCSRRNVPRLKDLSEEEAADVFLSAQRIARVLEHAYAASSVTLAVQDGPAAGQTVPHVHVHLLPRRPSDIVPNDAVYDKGGGPAAGGIDEAERAAAGSLSRGLDEERRPRPEAEMAAEAAELRRALAAAGLP
eukprot:tig00001160_g7348.t1